MRCTDGVAQQQGMWKHYACWHQSQLSAQIQVEAVLICSAGQQSVGQVALSSMSATHESSWKAQPGLNSSESLFIYSEAHAMTEVCGCLIF